MRNDFNWPLWHWHFELTSACTLKCPRCSRTEKPETLEQSDNSEKSEKPETRKA